MGNQSASTGIRWNRRRIVAGVGTTLIGGLAGCTGGGGGEDATTTTQAGATDTTGTEPGTATTAGDGETTAGDVEGPAFAEAIELTESYAFEVTTHEQGIEVSGRYDGDDAYHDIQLASGERIESYVVDGTSYVVTGGVCVVNPSAASDPTSDVNLRMTNHRTFQGHVEGHASVRPAGTTTIGGETMYAYDVSVNDVAATYYVSADTGLLRRYEQESPAGDVVVEFHSWGSVDPIEPPEMPCT